MSAKTPSPWQLLHCPPGLHLQITNSTTKLLLRISRQLMQSIKPQVKGPLECGALGDWSHAHEIGHEIKRERMLPGLV